MRLCLLALFLALASCGSDVSDAARTTIIAKDYYPPVANVEVTFTSAARGPGLLDLAGKAAARIGANTPEGRTLLPGAIDDVNVIFLGPSATGAAERFATATWRVDTLRRAVAAGDDAVAILNNATEIGTAAPSNTDIVRPWCERHPGGKICAQ